MSTKGTRLFDPPTAGDCVWAAAKVGGVREWLNTREGAACLEASAQLGLVIDLLAAIAGTADVRVTEDPK